MRNDKKNCWYTNVGLFSTSYLQSRISGRPDFPKTNEPYVLDAWGRLRQIWEKARPLAESGLQESDTEKQIIDKVLDVLNFEYLSKRQLKGARKNEKKFPDYGLFSSRGEVAEALAADDDHRYTNAFALCEAKAYDEVLKRYCQKLWISLKFRRRFVALA